jgi:hypothetical protein
LASERQLFHLFSVFSLSFEGGIIKCICNVDTTASALGRAERKYSEQIRQPLWNILKVAHILLRNTFLLVLLGKAKPVGIGCTKRGIEIGLKSAQKLTSSPMECDGR